MAASPQPSTSPAVNTDDASKSPKPDVPKDAAKPADASKTDGTKEEKLGDLFESVPLLLSTHRQAIDAVKAKLTEKWDDDIVVYRFLKGWKFNVDKSAELMNKMIKWRNENKLAEIHAKAIKMEQKNFPHFDRVVRGHPHNISHKYDRSGQPMSLERMGHAKPEQLTRLVKLEELTLYHMYHMENKANIAREMTAKTGTVIRMCKIMASCTALRHTLIRFLQDLDGLGMRHLHRGGLRYFKHVLGWTQEYYPEMLGSLYVVNTPWIFNQLWKVVKPWLNEFTLSKIKILGKDYKEELHRRVDPANLPPWLGGTCNCAGGCVVELDPDEGMTKVDIASRGQHTVRVEVTEAGPSQVSWEFRTVSKDIGVAVHFLPKGEAEDKKLVHQAMTRVEADKETISGVYEAKGEGVLTLLFDNSYSRWTAKTLLYRVDKSKEGASDGSSNPDSVLGPASPLGSADGKVGPGSGSSASAAGPSLQKQPTPDSQAQAQQLSPAAVNAASPSVQPQPPASA